MATSRRAITPKRSTTFHLVRASFPCLLKTDIFSVPRMPPYRQRHRPLLAFRITEDEGAVNLLNAVFFELSRQPHVGCVTPGNNEEAGRIFIQPMHDPGPQNTSDAGKVPTVKKQGVDKGPVKIARGGVNDHTGRFVHDDDRLVLINDVQGYILGDDLRTPLAPVFAG